MTMIRNSSGSEKHNDFRRFRLLDGSGFCSELTLLVCGEGVAVAVFLQLLPELHDVSALHEPLAARSRLTVTRRVPSEARRLSFLSGAVRTYLRRGLTMSRSSVL